MANHKQRNWISCLLDCQNRTDVYKIRKIVGRAQFCSAHCFLFRHTVYERHCLKQQTALQKKLFVCHTMGLAGAFTIRELRPASWR